MSMASWGAPIDSCSCPGTGTVLLEPAYYYMLFVIIIIKAFSTFSNGQAGTMVMSLLAYMA